MFYVCVFMYAYVCRQSGVSVIICLYVCIHIQVYNMYVCRNAYVCMCMYLCICECTCIYIIFVCKHIHMHMFSCVCMYAHM